MNLVCVKSYVKFLSLRGLKKLHKLCNGFDDFEQEIEGSSKSASRILLHTGILVDFHVHRWSSGGQNFFRRSRRPTKVYIFEKYLSRSVDL